MSTKLVSLTQSVYKGFMQNTIVNINGEIVDVDSAKISIFDRGFLYGDSLYEVVRTYDRKPLGLDSHLTRLERSAQLCRMTLGQTRDLYEKEILKTIQTYFEKSSDPSIEAYCRIIITRGIGKIGFGLSALQSPTQYIILVKPAPTFTDDDFMKGLSLKIVKRARNDPRALDPAMKSGNYLNNLLAFLEAASEDFDDALLCNTDGNVTEGTTFNIFYVRNGILATPPLRVGILEGITRKMVIELARKANIPIREIEFPKERLYEADEVFVTSSLKEVFPVLKIDQYKISQSKPGPMTLHLKKLIGEAIQTTLNVNQ